MTVKDWKVTSIICELKKLIIMIFIEKCTKKKKIEKKENVPTQESSTDMISLILMYTIGIPEICFLNGWNNLWRREQ